MTTNSAPPRSEAGDLPGAEPVVADWFKAYSLWLPGGIMSGETQVNDAFRAGYLAANREACAEINRLRAEGARRMEWILGLIDHAKALGAQYAEGWQTPGELAR